MICCLNELTNLNATSLASMKHSPPQRHLATSTTLFSDLYFAEGLRALSRVPVAVFQPKELLPLYPHLMARWLRADSAGSGAPPSPHKGRGLLWGLARPLHDLTTATQCVLMVELRVLVEASSFVGYLMEACIVLQRAQWACAHHMSTHTHSSTYACRHHILSPSAMPTHSATLLARSRSRQGAEGVDSPALAAQVQQHCEAATAAIADYLWLRRGEPSLQEADAVHTLLLLLLNQLDEHARVLAFSSEDNRVVVDEGLKRALEERGGYLAWAALCAQREGYVHEALATWRALALGDLVEGGEEQGEMGSVSGYVPCTGASATVIRIPLCPTV